MANGKQQTVSYSLTTGTIVRILLVLLLLFFLWNVRDILGLLFAALVFSSAIDNWVDRMQAKGFPRGISVLLVYIIMFGVMSIIVYLLIPPISEQVREISRQFPLIYNRAAQVFGTFQTFTAEHGLKQNVAQSLESVNQFLGRSVGNAFGAISSFFGGIASFFLVLILTFYMVVEEQAMKRALLGILPDKYQPFAAQLTHKIQNKIGAWLQGQLILCFVIGIVTTFLLWVAGVKYALVLGLIAGVLEFIPYLGPILAAVPALFLAFFQDPIKAVFVLIIYIAVQQLENNILVPKIMQRAVGLNPIITITALLVGMKLGGVSGALIAIPIATAISVVLREFSSAKTESP